MAHQKAGHHPAQASAGQVFRNPWAHDCAFFLVSCSHFTRIRPLESCAGEVCSGQRFDAYMPRFEQSKSLPTERVIRVDGEWCANRLLLQS
ncbi:hypothetical protein Agabi119p4_3340 [Agaricus bisporus var. burnettii]|uniref:Uncharacterized protein n=1 Tax=Agaricus bisporus var. burnettii TaxID=192524 RepID=A0A8H7F7A9_AGABI|nr:hypothetical protein Agabi119p4_3340 [Agaricus bisporus var. burnettii]